MNKNIPVLGFLISLGACTTPPPTYKNLMPLPTDARLSFESDFDLHTHFSTSVRPKEDECAKFDTAGYILKKNSLFIYDKPNTKIEIEVPSGKVVGVGGYHYFNDSTLKATCYAKSLFFVPEVSKSYVVKMNKVVTSKAFLGPERGFCFLGIEEVQEGLRLPVKAIEPPACR